MAAVCCGKTVIFIGLGRIGQGITVFPATEAEIWKIGSFAVTCDTVFQDAGTFIHGAFADQVGHIRRWEPVFDRM